jgi:hypothetical protein
MLNEGKYSVNEFEVYVPSPVKSASRNVAFGCQQVDPDGPFVVSIRV